MIGLVMPAVEQLWSYGETGYHSLSAAVVKQRYKREAMVSAFRILGEGQLSLTKFLLLTDRPVDLRDFKSRRSSTSSRERSSRPISTCSTTSRWTRSTTRGPSVNEGSKGVLLGLGDPVRELPREYYRAALDRGTVLPRSACSAAAASSSKGSELRTTEPDAAQRLLAARVDRHLATGRS
jgi:3-polyprenyl-4-hydroxybenzoate decarboxylase